MKIKNFQIRDFRNLKKIEYHPSPGLNIFYGDNAQGKTNILEALFYLSTGISFRTNKEKTLIRYEAPSFQIHARYNHQDRIIDSSINYGQEAKIFRINKKRASYNHPDRLRVILFSPDDLYLVKGAPNKRRFFIDFLLGQISNEYLFNLDNYRKSLKKRNLLLKKEEANGRSFAIINDIFIEYAAKLLISRLNLINVLDEAIQDIYPQINDDDGLLKIRYALSFPVDSGKINLDILQDSLKKQIENEAEKERKRKTTLLGPHLDDVHIYLNEQMARLFASQGQQRNIVICLKLAEIMTFQKIKGNFPIFLLDEVLAELDDARSNKLLNFLDQSSFQSFLTSVKMENTDALSVSISMVKDGCLLGKE
ncbi:MAG: DNA replication and repair protein RecF [Syntrophomonas sp.]|uniref:DNA replication/repair protein RecF n=1 Tax=Syntrophomonas sp. TaxID=2053627 RepID=UPI00260BDC48|nr:DNA replication and repair protein RecF [Syntrophomonas sp.]MDD2510005.1 DNA replication and repair protein RecF [Syntrophomonas sp.]MDD3878967.1 DNA replication and repair protein RecF [Syntrophomonas sp.]MDD4626118.1 DNA replication and repair protein RecF [Syntrophomonas sp.]